MNKLTHDRWNAPGYGSRAKRDELVQRLGQLEHRAERLEESICDHYCKMPGELDGYLLRALCQRCPMTTLMQMICGEYEEEP